MDQVSPYQREWASGLWRSEDMTLAQLTFQRELAHSSIQELGQMGICQFVDLNSEISAFQREYTRDVRRCEEAERKLRGFREQLETVSHAKGRTRIRVDPLAVVDTDPPARTLDDLDRRLQEIDEKLTEKQTRYMQLLEQRNRTIQYLEILDCTGDFLRASTTDFPTGSRSDANLQYLTGVIQTSKLFGFERAIHRASRGNFFIRKRPIAQALEDPRTLELVNYTVFVVFFAAQRVHDIVRKLADSVGAVVYDVPTSSAAESARLDLRAEQESHDHAQAAWEDELGALLSLIAGNIDEWTRVATVEKAIAGTLNLCRFSGSTAMAEVWVPKKRLRELRDALAQASHAGAAQVESLIRVMPTTRKHPTFFDTNKFTSNFQQIVDAYGVATYKEVNPGVATVVTFPFLFGIMYGDIGHGTMMLVLSLLLVLCEKPLGTITNEMFQMIFGGRYLLLLMSIFSIYIGILYNDCFGLMVGTPSGQWHFNGSAIDAQTGQPFDCNEFPEGEHYFHESNATIAAMQEACRTTHNSQISTLDPDYASNPLVGVDSGWAGAINRLDFYNSFKMKQAVILGVIHMLLGVCHGFMNYWRKNDWLRIYTMFIPEIIFLSFTFGWMDFLIIIKWLKHWTNPSTAPSLLTEMTGFFLSPGSPPTPCYNSPGNDMPPVGDPCHDQYDPEEGYWFLFYGQFYLQALLLLVAFAAVPTLLFPIPCIEYFKQKNAPVAAYAHHVGDEEEDGPVTHDEGEAHAEGEHHDFSEIVIHQIIHTIEYVLGCVSNTASYLRLWALSLAHAQLAEVFWDFTMKMPLEMHGFGLTAAAVFGGWAAWFVVTVGVLLGMEGLSAFLHALRLHWVEFQNKFYEGEGIAFTPLVLQPPPPTG